MPNTPGTPASRFRIDRELWEAFNDSMPEGVDRSTVLRDFVAYWCSRPGAELPERPPAGPWSTPPE
ncbi:hypothetical protein ACH4FV_03815 [Streptomyces anulatus]